MKDTTNPATEIVREAESRGQAYLIVSSVLPTQVRDRQVFEALGFVFGEPLADDPLFAPATLPLGWTKRATDDPRYSNILDQKGRVRAEVFHKAVVYDRQADLSLRGRYRFDDTWSAVDKTIFAVVLDGDREIFRTETFTSTNGIAYKSGISEKLTAAVAAWMDVNRPDWRDPIKQWESP